MWNLRIDAATAELVAALHARGVLSIVLKGPALHAVYPQGVARTYVDGDLLVPPRALETAAATLSDLGFVRVLDDEGLPEWWQEHASSWVRERDRGSIDLHRKLQGAGVPADVAWHRLWSDSVAITVAGQPARRLSDPALTMYVTLHAAHHGPAHGAGLAHLDAALTTVDEGTWRTAAALAGELRATDAFAAGLRLLPAGADLAQRLSLPVNRSVRVALQASSPPPAALSFDQLSSVGWRQRAGILLSKAFPPPGYLRYWWPPAARGRAMLAVGYGYRLIWLFRKAPRGWWAWRAARRAVAGVDRAAVSDAVGDD